MVLLLVGALSMALGLGWARATEPPGLNTAEPMSERSALGRQFYIQSCGGCHIAVPPEVLPTQTWQSLIQDSRHYGVQITPLLNPTLPVVWNYLQEFSRTYAEGQRIPFLIDNSRYFRALHPRVDVPRPVSLNGCASCHTAAAQFDFRTLSPQWDNAP